MAAFQKVEGFVEAVAHGKHDLSTDALKVLLTNTDPTASASVLANLTEIAAGNGYTTGGNAATVSSSAQAGGTYKLVLNDPATFTAAGGSIGPFRWAVLWNSSALAGDVIGYWDYGSSLTLADGESFTVDFSPTTGVLTIA